MCTDAWCPNFSPELLLDARHENGRRLLRGHSRLSRALDERVNEIQLLDDGLNNDLRHQVDKSDRPVELIDEKADLLKSLDQRFH